MRIRLLSVAICILTLPILFSSFTDNKLTYSTPFATVVFAGHSVGTNAYCECGDQDCICDPGERPMGAHRGNRAISDTTDKDASSTGEAPSPDFGTGAMLLALIVFAWARYRM